MSREYALLVLPDVRGIEPIQREDGNEKENILARGSAGSDFSSMCDLYKGVTLIVHRGKIHRLEAL